MKNKLGRKNVSVWLGSLAAYNAGQLVGEWVELPKEDEELREIIEGIHKEAEQVDGVYLSEEIDIFDYDIYIDGLEGYGLRKLNEIAERLDDLDDYDLKEIFALHEAIGDIEEAIEVHEEGNAIIVHDVEDNEDLGRMWVEQMGAIEVPEHLKSYIDYEAIGRDMSFSGWTITGEDMAVCID